jgi:hypothetical protein
MESVNFTLKTRDINPSNNELDYATNGLTKPIINQTSKGIVTNTRFTFTWYNVDFKAILGEMYDKYEYFKISLNFVAGSSGGSVQTYQDNHTVVVKMTGLGWISSYDNMKKSNSGSVSFTALNAAYISYGTWNFNNFSQQSHTFSKQAMATITIDLFQIFQEEMFMYLAYGQSQQFGQMVFGFTITGDNQYKTITDNSNKNNMIHRIF